MHLHNDDGPIANRDWPNGCIPAPTIAQVPPPHIPHELQSIHPSRSRTRRRLLTTDDDSDGSQGEKPSRASSSKASGSMRSAYQSLELDKPDSFLIPTTQKIHVVSPPVHQQVIPPAKPPSIVDLQPSASSTRSRPAQDSAASTSAHPVHPPLPTLTPIVTLIAAVKYEDFVHHLWYSFSVHEMLNIQLGLLEFHTFGATNLADSGMPASEIQEFHTVRHSFPHVPQRLLPATRSDGIPRQYLHLTQIPHDTTIDTTTGLSHSYQILIRFDFGYNEMTKVDVQEAAIARFDAMNVKLATRYKESVSALVHPQTKKWLGFMKVDLLNPNTDGTALLKGERIFTLQLQDLSYVIGKIEKGFKFSSTATNRRLSLANPILARYASRALMGELIRLDYLCRATLEFIGVSKRTKELETAEIIVASTSTKRYLLESPILVDGHFITISLPAVYATNPNAPVALSTSILVKGLLVDYSQNQVTTALHKLLRPQNILTITYNRAHDDSLGRHDGVATIRCLNSVVYIHWCNRKAVPLLDKLLDFSPHVKSLAGTHPTATARAQDQRPTREIIAEAITAFKNDTAPDPTLHQLTNTLHQVETRLKTHITSVSDGINAHTTTQVEAATAQQLHQHASIHK
jgi:hypothetical protein